MIILMMIVMMLVVVDLGGMRVGKRQELVFDSEFLTNNDGDGDGGGDGGGGTGQNLDGSGLS